MDPASGTRIFLLPRALRGGDNFLFVVAGPACLVCGQPSENPALSFAGECRPCRRRLPLLAGDQTVACAAYAASPSLRATLTPSLACARCPRRWNIAVRMKK